MICELVRHKIQFTGLYKAPSCAIFRKIKKVPAFPASLTFSPLLPFNPLIPSAPCKTWDQRRLNHHWLLRCKHFIIQHPKISWFGWNRKNLVYMTIISPIHLTFSLFYLNSSLSRISNWTLHSLRTLKWITLIKGTIFLTGSLMRSFPHHIWPMMMQHVTETRPKA